MDDRSDDPPNLFRAHRATVVRPTGETVFADLSWTIREGETWAVVGPVGSGKTALTEVLLGRSRTVGGTVEWPLLDRLRASGRPVGWPSEVITRVAFKEESRLFSYGRHYYQQRYNFIEPDDDLTLDQFLRTGVAASDDTLGRVTARLGLSQLRSLSFIKLSNGQTRRARIARALLAHPEVLIVDEPFIGLDAGGRAEVRTQLEKLRAEGTRLVLITAPDAIPDWVTHVLELDRQRVEFVGPRAEYRPRPGIASPVTPASPATPPTTAEPVIELRRVNVTHGGRPILQDVSWTVGAGERWAVLGPNGAGKTTLLSLICGDHPQAYSNDITVFGRRRGGGESIWDVKRRIGLVSPEMHLYFTEPLTADRAAATGFFDALVARSTTAAQDAAVRELFAYFGTADLADRPFGRLSSGQQRIVLLIRALVKDPPLLVLDEPFQVLDATTQQRAREWIDDRLAADRTVLFVTHNEAELPRTVTRRLRLQDGAVVEIA
ncbi:MAG TPA: ATP-binding cassette domain-containing protein [Gemmataceae bacterium]|nr:ATP-binding cassette domain-containing protein [Gemmataceae bacterium]